MNRSTKTWLVLTGLAGLSGLISASGIDGLSFSLSGLLTLIGSFAGMALAMVVESLAALSTGNNLKIWVRHPTKELTRKMEDPESRMSDVQKRLESIGFAYESMPDGGLRFSKKEKKQNVNSFLEHGFEGCVRVEKTGLKVQATMLTTLVIDSGEGAQLRALCEYLALGSDKLSAPILIFTAVAGAGTGCLSCLWLVGLRAGLSLAPTFVFSTAMCGLALSAHALYMIHRDPEGLLGRAIAIAGLAVNTVPFLALMLF